MRPAEFGLPAHTRYCPVRGTDRDGKWIQPRYRAEQEPAERWGQC